MLQNLHSIEALRNWINTFHGFRAKQAAIIALYYDFAATYVDEALHDDEAAKADFRGFIDYLMHHDIASYYTLEFYLDYLIQLRFGHLN